MDNFAALPYPLHIQQVSLANRQVVLYLPEPKALQQLYLQQKETDNNTSFPYWAKLWPSAIALATFIEQHPEYVLQKNVLELAAGLGLPSLVAASTASTVLCTDMAAEAMEAATKSATLAGLQNMQCRTLNWNDLDASMTADTLLLSDVNYEPEVFESLLNVLHRFLRNGTTILLATPQRLMAKPFVEKLMPYCGHQQTLEVKDDTGVHQISVYVLA
jgi:predicted nicotinamide N-methyase